MSPTLPPTEPSALAAWFAEAVNTELADLEKKGGDQRIELHSGRRIPSDQSFYVVYRFTLADNTLVPEEAGGTIQIEGQQFKTSVVACETSQIDLQVDGAEGLGAFIPRAILCVDDLGLLRRLAEVLEVIATGSESISRLATDIFQPKPDRVSKVSLPGIRALNALQGEQRSVVEQACASDITFVWGPPGTGKTFLIAHLIAALTERGERVLMTSHTHAALDQAIYETVKSNGENSNTNGPLANSDLERDGKIIRVGRVPSVSKVPESVRLDSIVKRKALGIQSELRELQQKAAPLSVTSSDLKTALAKWERLSDLRKRVEVAEQNVKKAAALAKHKQRELDQASHNVMEKREDIVLAQEWQPFDIFTTWLNVPAKRVARAHNALAEAESTFAQLSRLTKHVGEFVVEAEQTANSLRLQAETQADACTGLLAAENLEQQLAAVSAELDRIEQTLTERRRQLDALEKEVITNAHVVAATLTKCYVGDQLKDESFDAVIVDEVSMALPPLLFVAARRALRRVILVGDFKQLPPIVRSDNEVSDERLRQDTFHLAGIAHGLEPSDHPALTRLSKQRRMLPPIADAARHISYGPLALTDHEDVRNKAQPDWLVFLPPKALVIVDTADLHCWSGRQAGSLSRFNLYSAQIAVELAAMAAAGIPTPEQINARPIGIVTPYAAQRRLLSRLIQALNLSPWVAAGTVHTFQGGEAELIIFDAVLDEPYWTARLCNPNHSKEVKRDLNVAVTRARSKFVLVGSSEWLNLHAKPTSGLGQLWHYLKDHADLISVGDLIQPGISNRVVVRETHHYQIPLSGGVPVCDLLDENTFFDRLFHDLDQAEENILGLVAFVGEYRWAQVEPHVRAAVERGVEVTLIVCLPDPPKSQEFTKRVIATLRSSGVTVQQATGFHPKNIIIDNRILYTGSMNWASHRGLEELVHRFESPDLARLTLEYLQARHIRSAAGPGTQPRTCPQGHAVQVVNQARPMSQWDKQPIKIGCADYQSTGCKYLVDIDQRAPFVQPPLCGVDHRTKYRRVRRGRGEVWECPKHPKECERFKVVPGDPNC